MQTKPAYIFRGLLYWLKSLNPFTPYIKLEIKPIKIKLYAFKKDAVGRGIFKRGVHEPHITAWLIKNFQFERGNFIDVGANIGYYSLIFSKLAKKDGCVISIEPERENLQLLKKNLHEANCNNVHVFNCALAAEKGKARLSLYKASNRGRHTMQHDYGQGFQEVDCRRLDDILLDSQLNAIEIDLLKIDIEGHEIFALKGAEETLKRVKCIVLEYSPDLMTQVSKNTNAEALLKLVEKTHPKIYEFQDSSIQKTNFNEVLKNQTQRDLVFIRADLDPEKYGERRFI